MRHHGRTSEFLASAVRRIAAGALTACAATACAKPVSPPATAAIEVPSPDEAAESSGARPASAAAGRDAAGSPPRPGCFDRIRALDLANEADQMVKVNVEGAAAKYERALALCPPEHPIAFKLAQAFERKQDWERMAGVLADAIVLAPGFPTYHYERGRALTKLGEGGDATRFAEARVHLEECVRLDPNHADCHFLFGLASEHMLDDQLALEHYTRAIELDPGQASYFPPLAALYSVHRRYVETDQVLREGLRLTPVTDDTMESVYAMGILSFQVAQARGDQRGMLEALERAGEAAGDRHPDLLFSLGATYAAQDPPQQEQAIRLLNSFSRRACRSARSSQFREQCESAQALLQSLVANTSNRPGP